MSQKRITAEDFPFGPDTSEFWAKVGRLAVEQRDMLEAHLDYLRSVQMLLEQILAAVSEPATTTPSGPVGGGETGALRQADIEIKALRYEVSCLSKRLEKGQGSADYIRRSERAKVLRECAHQLDKAGYADHYQGKWRREADALERER